MYKLRGSTLDSDSCSKNQPSGSSSSPSAAAIKLCHDESVHSTLTKLFKTKNKSSVVTHSTAFVESKRPKITLKGGGGLSKEVVQKEAKAKNKPVTVVLLDAEYCNTVPKNKKKLRAENRLNFCNFLPADTVEDVNRKIRSIFPCELLTGRTLVFLQSTQSGDLFNAALGREVRNSHQMAKLL